MCCTARQQCFEMSTNDLNIVITNTSPVTYHRCHSYDAQLTESGEYWHMIIVHHDGRFSKSQILQRLFDEVSDSEFFPVAYTVIGLFSKTIQSKRLTRLILYYTAIELGGLFSNTPLPFGNCQAL